MIDLAHEECKSSMDRIWYVPVFMLPFGGNVKFLLNTSSVVWGLPEKKTLTRRSFVNCSKEGVRFLSYCVGVGINFRPKPIMFLRDLGMTVFLPVRSCIARFEGREK